MTRTRLEDQALNTWDDADRTLRRIGEIDRDLELITGDLNDTIDAAKAKAAADSATYIAEKKALELLLKRFCDAHRGDLGKAKSRELVFGTISWRKSVRLVIPNPAATLAKLKALRWLHLIKVEESLINKGLRKLSESELARIGAGLDSADVWGYEVDKTAIPEPDRRAA